MKHPGRWLWLILLVPIAFGLARLRFDVEVFDLLPADLPVVRGLKLYQEHFANARELLITIQGEDPAQVEHVARGVAESLRARSNLVASVTWEPPWQERPEQLSELLAYLWFNQSPALLQQLTNQLAPDKLREQVLAVREQLATTLSPEEIARLSYDPFGLTRLPDAIAGAAPDMAQGQDAFKSADGKFRLLYVQAARELPTFRECARWLDEIKAIVSAASGGGAARIGFTGRPAFVAEIAGGMQHDVTTSVGGTALIIAILFWLAHRRLKPMLWLLTLLALILGSTLAVGGLIFGTINVVSMGFAAILLGLAVDYAVVHYQEALAQPELSIPEVRGAIAPSIFWAAVTTISAFLVLNFGGLPGLGQLGTLVGIGVALAACIMIFEFLPPLFPERRERGENAKQTSATPKHEAAPPGVGTAHSAPGFEHSRSMGKRQRTAALQKAGAPTKAPEPLSHLRFQLVVAGTVSLVIFVGLVLFRGLPAIDPTANALRPKHSSAYNVMDQIKRQLNQGREPLWVIISGKTESEVANRLEAVQPLLQQAVSNNTITSYTLPTALWPHPEFQQANVTAVRQLVAERPALEQAALTNGFTRDALGLTERMLDTWQAATEARGVFWPSNQLSRWILEKLSASTPTNDFALGLLNPTTAGGHQAGARLQALGNQLARAGVLLSGWELLGEAIFGRVKANMWFVLAPMVCLVFASLLLAFRRPREVLLSLGVLLLSAFCLMAVMRVAGWSWNLLNLMALPLILGTGVDYSIFMQLALRRHRGDLALAYHSVGRALLLCGGTACAGFGSLSFSSNAGMGSLGQVCAVGIGCNMLISIFLLPVCWRWFEGAGATGGPPGAALPSKPSRLYSAGLWRLGLRLIRVLPRSCWEWVSGLFATAYWHLAPHRREVVTRNLSPALDGDAGAGLASAKRLFHQFAWKVLDLWRYEAGMPIDDLFGRYSGWEHFLAAQKEKRGIVLLTPHLGNWEFGAPWLARRGVALQVITMAEPSPEFTRLRQNSRARWNIETLVIGEDPFTFLEVIKRLESGATIALLVDRPPEPSAVTVELFGKPFAASIAAAELARASGCVLLPVYLPRVGKGYEAHILPPIAYDRAALRDRAARQRLTQEIIRVFEPLIREHLEQWYHFVPVWTRDG